MMTGGWGAPPVDIKDPSLTLYLPLWYPDSETTGSPIISKDIYRSSCAVTEAVWRPTGRYFDGTNDYIDCGTQNITGAISIGVWFRRLTAANKCICGTGSFTWRPGYSIGFGAASVTGVSFYRGTTTAYDALTSSVFLASNVWAHYVAVWDGLTNADSMRIYINGQLLNSGAAAVASTVNSATFKIGCDGYKDFYSNADVGDALVYNRALTLTEILQIYQATKWRYL